MTTDPIEELRDPDRMHTLFCSDACWGLSELDYLADGHGLDRKRAAAHLARVLVSLAGMEAEHGSR